MIFFGWEIVMFSKKIATTRDITFFGPMNASSKIIIEKQWKTSKKIIYYEKKYTVINLKRHNYWNLMPAFPNWLTQVFMPLYHLSLEI